MSKVTDLVAAVTNIDGLDYRTINPEGGDWQAAAVAEGAQLPTATLRTSSGLVKLYKRGQVLSSSYEALRLQRLDLFTVALAQIGAGIAAAQMNDAVNALINGMAPRAASPLRRSLAPLWRTAIFCLCGEACLPIS